MICPSCNMDQSTCRDSRQCGLARERLYVCLSCGARYYTTETVTGIGQRPRKKRRRSTDENA